MCEQQSDFGMNANMIENVNAVNHWQKQNQKLTESHINQKNYKYYPNKQQPLPQITKPNQSCSNNATCSNNNGYYNFNTFDNFSNSKYTSNKR